MPSPSSESISDDDIRVCLTYGPDNKKSYFRMKRDHPVRKVMAAFCKLRNLDYRSMVFLYNGKRVERNSTPIKLEMEDKDEILVMPHQYGGGY